MDRYTTPPVVIDGANICGGVCDPRKLRATLKYFSDKGFSRVFAFIPQYWTQLKPKDGSKENALMITDRVDEMNELIKLKLAVSTPSQTHDDYFILGYAREQNGFIVSNDMFRDHVAKEPNLEERKALQQWIREHVITFTFVTDDEFVPDPTGLYRLRQDSSSSSAANTFQTDAYSEHMESIKSHGLDNNPVSCAACASRYDQILSYDQRPPNQHTTNTLDSDMDIDMCIDYNKNPSSSIFDTSTDHAFRHTYAPTPSTEIKPHHESLTRKSSPPEGSQFDVAATKRDSTTIVTSRAQAFRYISEKCEELGQSWWNMHSNNYDHSAILKKHAQASWGSLLESSKLRLIGKLRKMFASRPFTVLEQHKIYLLVPEIAVCAAIRSFEAHMNNLEELSNLGERDWEYQDPISELWTPMRQHEHNQLLNTLIEEKIDSWNEL